MNQSSSVESPLPLFDFVAWTAGGDVALVDGATGAIRQTVATSAPGDRDLAWDPWADRVVVIEGGEDDGGEIVAVPRVGGSLGARVHVAWLDGRARLLPTPHGIVVFEEGYGERWKLLGLSPTPSVIAPPPASAWLSVDAQGATVHGLGHGEGTLERRAAIVGSSGIAAPTVQPLSAAPATVPPTARLVPAPAAGDAILVDVAGDALVLRPVIGASAGEASLVPLPAAGMRIEAAVPLRGGRVVALLLSGATAQIAAVALDPAGVVSGSAHLPLPGEVTAAPRFFSRDLAAQGEDRVLAATGAGVHAVQVTGEEDGGVQLAMASGFAGSALRGPIAVLDPPP